MISTSNCFYNIEFQTVIKENSVGIIMNATNMDNRSQEINQEPQNYETISIITFVTEATVIIIGLIGNSLCFAVTLKTDLRKISSSVYLSVLAVCDNVILLWCCVIGNLLLSEVWLGKDLRYVHLVFCWGIEYVDYWLSQVSSWCLVAFTMERVVAALFPHRYGMSCLSNCCLFK